MNSSHPNLSYSFSGVHLLLERNNGMSSLESRKWRLRVDGNLVEESTISKAGIRDFKNHQEGSYMIATHFTPSTTARAVFVFKVGKDSYNVTVGHDVANGRVELCVNGELYSGRPFKVRSLLSTSVLCCVFLLFSADDDKRYLRYSLI